MHTTAPADILVVDDSSPNRDLLSELMREQGHAVRVAGTGEEALELARQRAPDLVLLDVVMPGIDGYQTCRQLHAEATTRSVPVLFLSGSELGSARVKGFEAGGVDFVNKPFDFHELTARVATHLALRRLQRQAEARTAELEQANQRLRELEALRQRLSAAIVHDLKSPLTPVLQNAEWLMNRPGLDGEVQEAVSEVYVAANSMHRLVLSLLDVARSSDTRLVPQRQPVAVRDWLEKATTFARLKARATGHRLQLKSQEADAFSFDPELMGRCVENLLDNALKYAPHGSPVLVSAHCRDEGGLEVRIRDRGPGIPDAMKSRIFEPWTRLDSADDPQARSSHGLGLAFCKQAVEAHAGQLAVEDAPGGGSLFVIRLPA